MIEALTTPERGLIATRVESLLGDRVLAAPAAADPDGLLGRHAVCRRVHGNVASMLAGGVAALLLQMLHPAVLAGVWDHSRFRHDMGGRLRGTARFVTETTYGTREQAERAIAAVRTIHRGIRGTCPDGTPYAADDPELLDWVHLSGTIGFLAAWRRYAERSMSGADQDRYFAEMAEVALALGASRPPRSRRDAERLVRDYRPRLRFDCRTREVAGIVLDPTPTQDVPPALAKLVTRAGLDLLPGWAKGMHGRSLSLVEKAAVRSGLHLFAGVVDWERPAAGRTQPHSP